MYHVETRLFPISKKYEFSVFEVKNKCQTYGCMVRWILNDMMCFKIAWNG